MIQSVIVDSAKEDFLNGIHLPNDRYKIALYSDDADLGSETMAYTPENEADGFGYTPGGKSLSTPIVRVKNGEATMTFMNPIVWENASITARGAMIYNATKGNKTLAVFAFKEGNVASTNGPFAVSIPDDGAIILT